MIFPGLASSIGRAFAYQSSDPSLNTAADRWGPLLRWWQLKTGNLDFSKILPPSNKLITPSTGYKWKANFHSPNEQKRHIGSKIGPMMHLFRSWTHDFIILYYTTLQPILQPRTAFTYKTPTKKRVAGNVTSIPRPSLKRLDISEAPNTEGLACKRRMRDGKNNDIEEDISDTSNSLLNGFSSLHLWNAKFIYRYKKYVLCIIIFLCA